MKKPHVIVIGAGPGGLTATRRLISSGHVNVTLIQREGMTQYLPGILPVLLGLQPVSMYRHALRLPLVQVLAGEVDEVQIGRVHIADGTVLEADAVIAAPGLMSNATASPVGTHSFPIWELEAASAAQQAVQSLTSGRVAVVISSLYSKLVTSPLDTGPEQGYTCSMN